MSGGEVYRYADAAMYRSDAMPTDESGRVRPRVYLLNATPDPFGSLAALNGIYVGRVRRSLTEVTDAEREEAWEEVRKNVLGNGPLESIQFHFFIEGVTRAFTHQAVRSRASFFAQESLRFAVTEGQPWSERVAYPPSLGAEPEDAYPVYMRGLPETAGVKPFSSPEAEDYALKRDTWDDAVIAVQNAYQRLIDAGIPAEDARGLMPHSMTTRYHWIVDLRTLLAEAGKRLCTQAQFEWRAVFAEVVRALREYEGGVYAEGDPDHMDNIRADYWQYEAIADALRPLCYQEGHCGFMSKFDRGCTIRSRVEAFAKAGIPSNAWHSAGWVDAGRKPLLPIRPAEWLTDPDAARKTPGPGACGQADCAHAPDGGNHPTAGGGLRDG